MPFTLSVPAATAAKANKKLRKLQGIACDAQQAHSAVIVDASLLQDEASSDGQDGNPACTTAACVAAASASRRAASAAAHSETSGSKRSSKQKTGSYVPSSIAAGAEHLLQIADCYMITAVKHCQPHLLSLPTPDQLSNVAVWLQVAGQARKWKPPAARMLKLGGHQSVAAAIMGCWSWCAASWHS